MKKFLLALILLSLFLQTGCAAFSYIPRPMASQGVMDLSGWDYTRTDVVMLNGQWEFYWDQLLEPQDLLADQNNLGQLRQNQNNMVQPDFYADVPSLWNQYQLEGIHLPGHGYATYRLHVITDLPPGTHLGIRPNTFSSAYRIFVDDQLIAAAGQVSQDPTGELPELLPNAIFFDAPAREFDLIVQVSNHHYARGGFWYSLPFGTADGILNYHVKVIGQELFLLGALFIIALFNLIIVMTHRELRFSLYFSLACMAMGINFDLVSGQTLLATLFPSLTYNAQMYLWYASGDWILLLLLFYFHELFRSRLSRILTRVVLICLIPFQVLYLLTEPAFYSETATVGNGVQYLSLACILLIIAQGTRSGRRDGWFSLISLFLLAAASTHDGLQWSGTIHTGWGDILYLGILVFLILHVILQAFRIRQYHDRKNAAELAFLQAQIKPHFLFNALNTFSAVALTDSRKAQKLISDLSTYLRRSFDFKEIRQTATIRKELELLEAYLEIEQARFGERIQINTVITVDESIELPILMLQPIVENAIVHGILPRQEGGRIDLSLHQMEHELVIQVRDDGVGMTAGEVREILQQNRSDGIGLYNIQERLQRLYGSGTGLAINSRPGSGTTVTISIPVKMKTKIKGR